MCEWVLNRVSVHFFLHTAYYIDAAYIRGASVQIVLGAKEDEVRCKGKEYWWYLAEAVSYCKYINHSLSGSKK